MTAVTARTNNGAPAHATTENPVLDFFFAVGGSRNLSEEQLINQFNAAYRSDAELASRVALWARDARGGAGERRAFRVVFKHLIEIDPDRARRVLALIPELGRWDDVLVAQETPLEDDAVALIASALKNSDRLCAKWMPRKGTKAARLRRGLHMTPKQYRKTLVGLTSVVETKMCDQKWEEIAYGSVPSVAHSRYRRAFARHDPVGYAAFLENVSNGADKINAGAVFPYDVLRGRNRISDAAEASAIQVQWEALPDLLGGEPASILPVVDVSGSMCTSVSGSVTALDVAVSLGLYLSERIQGQFQNQFVTFSTEPEMIEVDGSILNRLDKMVQSNWGMSTNIEAVFKLILQAARTYGLKQEDLPTKVLILSDMQFDAATSTGGYWNSTPTTTNYEAIDAMFESYGYQRPQLVFWNINGTSGTTPITQGEAGTALVSGFSPNIVRSVLASDIDPVSVMMDAIGSDRYDH